MTRKYKVTLTLTDMPNGRVVLQTKTTPKIPNGATVDSTAVQLSVFLQELIIAKMNGVPTDAKKPSPQSA